MMDTFLSDSDWESASESGSSEDREETEYLYVGQARSILSSLEESIGKIDDFLSFERGFVLGDLVCSETDTAGQMGRVVGIDMLVDLESAQGKIMKNVNSKKLLKIRSISVGDYVICGPWLGMVDKVVDKVTVVFDDGSKREVTAMDQENLLPISPNMLEDSQYPYYPGQRVRVRLSEVTKSARRFCGTWRQNQDEGTVCAVEAGLVSVEWFASVPVGCDLSLPIPPRLQDSRNLTLLSCFSHANWQLGDWCMLPSADSKGVMEQTFLNASTGKLINENLTRGFKRSHTSNLEELFVIVKTKTKVDVMWQDGSCSFGLDSQNLCPVSVVNIYEFLPEQFVLEKGTCDDPLISSSQRWGVVRSVDAKERTVNVQWTTLAMSEANNLDGSSIEETLSAYELVEHPEFSYCLGDVVFRLVQNQFGDPANKDHVNSETGMGEEATLKGEYCTKDQTQYPNNSYLSCIGNVTGFEDGAVEVRWATGFATKVAPYEIFRVDKSEGSSATHVLFEENVEETNQEMIEHDKQSYNQKGKDLFDSDRAGENCKKHSWESSSFFLPQAAFGFLMSIATNLFGSVGSTSLPCPVVSSLISEDGDEAGILPEEDVLESCDLLQTFRKTSLDHEVKETLDNESIPFSATTENSHQFMQFDMVGDCSDHHFLNAGKGLALSQAKRSWFKKVQQEWSILEKNLPETIYVRVFDERMDLLRAVIVGAPGTPYHDGLFFFDILLPLEYPYEPPMVHYNSGGLRVNPNLYESGKVCLSLLNTWTGTGSEVWNPESSTILQVLLSLQALVLNEKPYFNEAGYDKQIGRAEGEKNSVSYNENAFLVTCKSMLYLLRKPPKHFEALVEDHFKRRSQHILMACKAYMEGAPVGCAFGCGKTDNVENLTGNSTGFKIMLAKLLPKLVEAFADRGMDYSQFIEPAK
ncbi:probable ubiquitin-conjugating enzyme E2 24 [Corylus avellana]|uniref:probable ubiquitin-conjugating enzyme E2 24 n=1 Tax=Corylus avellana TaxID=13451 RepID=UPI00286C86FC|nr:probable ubiquitin-conjugating enzyme E2 24 [Corylus avellana]XP_059437351.1 probable ubiquitin-conjugating enzyme E2 24 [Corylus avellana]XP_059437352.1 probable ubiquitin-conjugating enzyme E2 24 [Corylus avellana]XP_059437353.1 probable ubiquitin-conjugating enzyme E2 24 [Corylus avellana]